MAKRAQVMAAAPAASPSLLAKAYAAAVVSRKTNARKTKSFVQMPALWVWALTPNENDGPLERVNLVLPIIEALTTMV
jgi:hypothetical protein